MKDDGMEDEIRSYNDLLKFWLLLVGEAIGSVGGCQEETPA